MDRNLYHEIAKSEDHHWWFKGRRAIIESTLRAFEIPQNEKKILEIGCGSGGNLGLLKTFGEVEAIELDDEMRDIANSRKEAMVSCGSLPDNLNTHKKYDLICLFDVLEHVEKDSASLKNIGTLLEDGGSIVITVPAFMFLWSQHDEENFHFRRYQSGQLRKILLEAGFQVQYTTYFNTFLFPIILLVRLAGKILRQKSHDVKMPAPAINNILTAIFSSEAKLLPKINFPFGVSLLCVAVKEPE